MIIRVMMSCQSSHGGVRLPANLLKRPWQLSYVKTHRDYRTDSESDGQSLGRGAAAAGFATTQQV